MTVLAYLKALVIEQLEFVLVWMDSLEPTVQVSGMWQFLKEMTLMPQIFSIPKVEHDQPCSPFVVIVFTEEFVYQINIYELISVCS